jgi:hypothetical protein
MRKTPKKKPPAKMQISASIDREAMQLLHRMAADDRRSISGQLNTLIYEAGSMRGMDVSYVPDRVAIP